MKIAIIFIAFLLIFILLFAPIRLFVSLKRCGDKTDVSLRLEYLFFKFKLFGGEKKSEKADEKKEKNKPSFEKEKLKIEKYIRIFEAIRGDAARVFDYAGRRAVIFEKISFRMDFGFENAMHTGIFTGLANGLVYSVLGFIHNNSRLEKMDVFIQPEFEKIGFDVTSECIIRTKSVHIIYISFNVLKILKKIKRLERRS